MTTFGDLVYQLGGVPLGLEGIPFGPESQIKFFSPATGSDDNDGSTPDKAFASFEAGEDALVANRHDTLVYLSGSSANAITAAVTWDKSYTHLVGMCAPTGVANRARLMYETGTTAASPLITISASGCIFKNFYVFHGIASASNLINVYVTGGRNYFENVHFAGGGHATQAVDGGASLMLDTTDCEENLFRHCTIGVDTIAAATGMAGMRLDGACHRNIFEDCNFTLYAGDAGAIFVEVVDSLGIDRYTIFKRCLFTNTSLTEMTEAFAIPAMGAPRLIYLIDCALHGAADWDSNSRGNMFLSSGTITAGGNAGIMQAVNAT
jgi:hypothetical protein